MKMKLPLSWPITETYQSSSFVMSIILAHENIKHSYENNYVNLSCHDTNQLWDMGLNFWGVTWEDFRKYGIFEMDLFSIESFSKNTLSSFLRERIDQGNYLLLHMVDEFFLPYSDFYHNRHFIHDTYIYGYEDDFFWIMAYSNSKLQQIKISASDIEQSLFSAKNYEAEVYFCSLRPNHAINVNVDYQLIKHNIYEYLGYRSFSPTYYTPRSNNTDMLTYVPSTPPRTDNYVYGNNIYMVLNNCLCNILENHDSDHTSIDIRPFRLLLEHKRILQERINYIICQNNLSTNILVSFEEITARAKQLFMLAIKYHLTEQKKIIKNMTNYISELKDLEEILLTRFLNEWETKEKRN